MDLLTKQDVVQQLSPDERLELAETILEAHGDKLYSVMNIHRDPKTKKATVSVQFTPMGRTTIQLS